MLDGVRFRRLFGSLAIAVLIAGCEKGPTGSSPDAAGSADLEAFAGLSGTIGIAGGTAHIPVMKDAAARIMAAHPAIRITVEGGGSGVGIKKVTEGIVEIGNTGRPPSKDEMEKGGLRSFPFAIDGVAVCIHPSNPIAGLTREQVKSIFAGTIADWKEAGGKEGQVHLFTRDEASGTREVFWEKLLEKGTIADGANVVASNGAMKVAIAGDPGAIGYVSIGHVDDTIKAVPLDGIAPSQENAASGKYPIVRNLYMNTKGAPAPLIAAFIDSIYSPAGIESIRKAGYIPIPKAAAEGK